jgi:hypothetical protein
MSAKKKTLKRKAAEAGGWMVAKRIARSVPYLGGAVAIGMIGYDIKKKGVVKGVLNSTLDAIPMVGLGKNVIEFFTGDLLPDKKTNELKMPKHNYSDKDNKGK